MTTERRTEVRNKNGAMGKFGYWVVTTMLVVSMMADGVQCAYNPSTIIKLSDRNIRIAIKKYQRVLIFFHSKWCNHSKSALKNLTMLAKSENSSKIKKMRVVLSQFNSREEKDILNELRIKENPSMKLLIEGAEIAYNKPDFSQENILGFLEENVQREIYSFYEISEMQKIKNPKIVFYGYEKSHRYPLFRSASFTFKDLNFVLLKPKRGKVTKAERKKLRKLNEDNINIYDENGKLSHYKKAWTQNRINDWIFYTLNPGIVDLNEDFYRLVVLKKNPAFLFIVRFSA